MAIKYFKKANKTPTSDEVETRQRVQEILQQIENTREEGVKEISRKFDKYEGDIILSQEKIEDVIKSLDQKIKQWQSSILKKQIKHRHLMNWKLGSEFKKFCNK